MSLDVSKLEKVRLLGGGLVQARCPACAEGGNDRKGEHLRIYPDGRFGCCVHPKDGVHRKRVFALAGVRKPGSFTLRVKTAPAMTNSWSVKAALTAFNQGTLGTAKSESVSTEPGKAIGADRECSESGTRGTVELKLRARARVDSTAGTKIEGDLHGELKDRESAVLNVPMLVPPEPPSTAGERLPFLTSGGTLSIPFDSPEQYHWWCGGQSIDETLKEVKERMEHAVIV